MALNVRYDKATSAYCVEQRDEWGKLALSTRRFEDHGAAQAYLRACEEGRARFSAMAGKTEEAEDKEAAALPAVPVEAGHALARTAAGLRNILFDEIEKVRAGTVDESRLKAISSAASQIVSITRLELDFVRAAKENPELDTYDPNRVRLGDR